MPCTYYTPQEEAAIARAELDELTRLLCDAIKLLRAAEVPIYSDLRAWAQEHDEMDAARLKGEAEHAERSEQRETHRRKALSKLSKAEREALGVYE